MPFPNFISKLYEFPLVNTVATTSCGVYNHVKSSHSFVHTTLSTAEAAVNVAVQMALPLADQFREPIEKVDMKLARGLQVLEEKVPLVTEQPSQIFERTRECASVRIENIASYAASGASSIKENVNNALRTPAGNIAMNTLDATSNMTDRAIDYCFPPRQGEEELHPHSNSYCDDKVYHVVHTVGTLGIKAGRKVCYAVSQRRQRSEANSSTSDSDESETEDFSTPITSPPDTIKSKKNIH